MRILIALIGACSAAPPEGMMIGSVSQPLTAKDGSTYLIFLPPKWTASGPHPVMLFLHGVGGINNGDGCRNPGLTTQFPLLDPAYAAKVPHIVLVPVAKQKDWRHHFGSSMALVDMAISELGGDATRVTVAGQSMGGHGAWLYASQLAPGRFCAVIAMCGYLDSDAPIGDVVPPVVLEPLKTTPVWVFHAEVDDEVPPPGRPQDDGAVVANAFRAAGNDRVQYTRYPSGKRPPNYIPGHAAFEFAFHDDGLWPWLAAQQLPAPPSQRAAIGAAGAVVALVGLYFVARSLRLERVISTVALLLSSVAFLGLMQSEGGLLDTCYGYSFAGVDTPRCQQIGADILAGGESAEGYMALAVSKARAENCFALGMGIGALYALACLAKGTREVAVVHLMHAAWASSVCAVNAQNAGLLHVIGIPAEANLTPRASAKLAPFVVITGVQAFLGALSFLLSSSRAPPSTAKEHAS